MSILEQPLYAGLRRFICNEWDYALNEAIDPYHAWERIVNRLNGMADYALLVQRNDDDFETLRFLSDMALEHQLSALNSGVQQP
ncbi:MAG: hypothetical protein R3E93_15910 [Thiothrix sp.]